MLFIFGNSYYFMYATEQVERLLFELGTILLSQYNVLGYRRFFRKFLPLNMYIWQRPKTTGVCIGSGSPRTYGAMFGCLSLSLSYEFGIPLQIIIEKCVLLAFQIAEHLCQTQEEGTYS